MSRELGVYPCRINSKLLTAQLRDRYYWSNIRTKETMFDLVTDIPQPKDRGIMFKDIITGGYVERVKANALLEGDHKQFIKDELKQSIYLKSRIEKGKQPPNLIYVDTDKHVALKMQNNRNNQSSQESLKHRNETTGMITLIYEVNDELRCKTNTSKGYDIVTENDCIDLSFPTSTTRRGRVTKLVKSIYSSVGDSSTISSVSLNSEVKLNGLWSEA